VDSQEKRARVVGGSLAYRSAAMIEADRNIPFEQAFALTKLILEEGGGPVPLTGKGARISKPVVSALTSAGLIEQILSADFIQRVYLEVTLDSRLKELLDKNESRLKITPMYAIPRYTRLAQATQAAFDLLAACLP
jgi:hypothetical protein